MSKKKKIYFQKSWLDQEQYMDWLAESPEGTNVKCKLCKKVLKILNMAKDALRSYAHSERHKQEINIFRGIQLFFHKACMKSSSTILAKSDSTYIIKSLSCHEQVCLSGPTFREILLPSSGKVNDYVAHI